MVFISFPQWILEVGRQNEINCILHKIYLVGYEYPVMCNACIWLDDYITSISIHHYILAIDYLQRLSYKSSVVHSCFYGNSSDSATQHENFSFIKQMDIDIWNKWICILFQIYLCFVYNYVYCKTT